jgi:hypothetical protein
LIKDRQGGVLVWRESGATTSGETELHLPRSFAAANTVVVSDIAVLRGVRATGPIKLATETGSTTANRLVITATGGAGTVHVALIINAATGPAVQPGRLTAAAGELAAWKDQHFPAG